MEQKIISNHKLDENENPAGGYTHGTGFTITWQDGPLGRINSVHRQEPNGAFVEGIIQAAIDRIEFYQSGKFNCIENNAALEHLKAALDCLNERTKRRTKQNVEGTHEGN